MTTKRNGDLAVSGTELWVACMASLGSVLVGFVTELLQHALMVCMHMLQSILFLCPRFCPGGNADSHPWLQQHGEGLDAAALPHASPLALPPDLPPARTEPVALLFLVSTES